MLYFVLLMNEFFIQKDDKLRENSLLWHQFTSRPHAVNGRHLDKIFTLLSLIGKKLDIETLHEVKVVTVPKTKLKSKIIVTVKVSHRLIAVTVGVKGHMYLGHSK